MVFKAEGTIEDYFQRMKDLIEELGPKCAAIGECGLDYDRLKFSSKEQQLEIFPLHFELAAQYNLPLYLHSRNCEEDFVRKS